MTEPVEPQVRHSHTEVAIVSGCPACEQSFYLRSVRGQGPARGLVQAPPGERLSDQVKAAENADRAAEVAKAYAIVERSRNQQRDAARRRWQEKSIFYRLKRRWLDK